MSRSVWLVSYPEKVTPWMRFLLHELLAGPVERWSDLDRMVPEVGRDSLPRIGPLWCTHDPYDVHVQRFGPAMRGFILVTPERSSRAATWIAACVRHPHVVVPYPALCADPVRALRRIGDFLQVFPSDVDLEGIVARCSPAARQRVRERDLATA
ncbi:MAG: hypothetical protein AAGA48_16495 [Myxococcota bacterium]